VLNAVEPLPCNRRIPCLCPRRQVAFAGAVGPSDCAQRCTHGGSVSPQFGDPADHGFKLEYFFQPTYELRPGFRAALARSSQPPRREASKSPCSAIPPP
jgi:hypothetical protein